MYQIPQRAINGFQKRDGILSTFQWAHKGFIHIVFNVVPKLILLIDFPGINKFPNQLIFFFS